MNTMLGLLMAVRYSPVRSWPHRQFNYFRLHNWSGTIALMLCILHPLILLFNKPLRFHVIDIVYPVHSPNQPFENTLGGLALYMVAGIVVTSYLRIQLGRRLWKAMHFTIYIAAIALFWHSLSTDPGLTNATIDWFDGGKIFIEACLALVIVVTVLRWRFGVKRSGMRSHIHAQEFVQKMQSGGQ